jgi:hypothetical protein
MHNDEINELKHRFGYHPPKTDDVIVDHEDSRKDAFNFAYFGAERIPASAGREKALFLTKVEEALFWLNAGIARGNAERVEVGE